MISKEAKKIILDKRNSWDKDGYAISKDNAIKAIELAEQKMRDKAIELHRKSCFYLCSNNKCILFIHNSKFKYRECDGDCLYVRNFKKLLNK
jgi:hypothetical protein